MELAKGEKFATNSLEKAEEQAYHEEKAAEIINDKLSVTQIAEQMRQMKEQFEQQQIMLNNMLARMGFQKDPAADEVIEKPKANVPIDAIICIYLPEGFTPQEREPVPVGINGDIRWLPRGQYVHVTPAELSNLQNCKYEGEHYPVENDTPLATKEGRSHFTLSRAVKYSKPRFPLLVQNLPQP